MHIRPFCFYLPISGIFFCLISIIISSRALEVIMVEVFIGTLRLLLMISIMTIYVIESQNQLLFAIRSLWYSSRFNIHLIDKLILFFELAIRFFPNIQYKWNQIQRSQNALSIKISKYSIESLVNIARFVPDFIILNLDNSNRVVDNMYMRGYGKTTRRSIYPFIKLHFYDMIIFTFVLIGLSGIHYFA